MHEQPCPPGHGNAAPPPATSSVGEAGEAGLLASILPRTKPADAAIVPTGDDAAVVAAPDGRYVVTTDLMVEGPDFRRAWHDPHDLGWKACASNLADVAAMGARPTSVVVALALPDETPVSWVEAFGAGFAAGLEAMAPGAGIVGGDLSTASQIVVSVTAFGDLEARKPVLRSGARVGDIVALAGDAGRSVSGLALFLAAERADRDGPGAGRDAAVPDAAGAAASAIDRLRAVHAGEGDVADRSPDDAQHHVIREVLRAHLAPTPPIGAGAAAADAGASGLMDVSDGLLLDASRLARASRARIDLDSAAFEADVARLRELPAADGSRLGDAAALERCLTGGEDHALLATFPPGAELPRPFRVIGRVVAEQRSRDEPGEPAPSRVLIDGEPRDAIGWDPYAGLAGFDRGDQATGEASS